MAAGAGSIASGADGAGVKGGVVGWAGGITPPPKRLPLSVAYREFGGVAGGADGAAAHASLPRASATRAPPGAPNLSSIGGTAAAGSVGGVAAYAAAADGSGWSGTGEAAAGEAYGPTCGVIDERPEGADGGVAAAGGAAANAGGSAGFAP
jgi:hypothetical protein